LKALGVAGASVGAGVGAKKLLSKEKKSSALETLVAARANEILEQSGIDPASLTQEEQEKVSDPREALAAAVEQRAWDMLGQYGVVPADQE
jgi:hypothetical protein